MSGASTVVATSRLPGFVTERLPAIRAACEQFRVERLWMYGSAVRSDYVRGRSDLDFMVVFAPEARTSYDGPSEHHPFGPPTRPGAAYPVNYRAFHAALTDIFEGWLTTVEGREPVEIGTYTFIDNDVFRAAVDAGKVELFART